MDMIKPIDRDSNLEQAAMVVRAAFATVAEEFGLTPDNCPTHASLTTGEQLGAMCEEGGEMFGLFLDAVLAGFAALEDGGSGIFYIEKLAVLPECRHQGYGEQLMRFACDLAVIRGGTRASVGIIDESTVLAEWYARLGFNDRETREYPHLPFRVRIMEKELS